MVKDTNSLVLDPELAAQTRCGSVIAPPVMVDDVAGQGVWPPVREGPRRSQFVPTRGARFSSRPAVQVRAGVVHLPDASRARLRMRSAVLHPGFSRAQPFQRQAVAEQVHEQPLQVLRQEDARIAQDERRPARDLPSQLPSPG
jgi:hypothetical protein